MFRKKNEGVRSAIRILVMMMCLMLAAGCVRVPENTESPEGKNLKIARQFGLAYAPLTVMEQMGLIEKHAPALKVEWVQLSNTAAIREAILTDQLDIGFMGIPPYLIGVENGMGWQAFTGLSQAPLGLMTNSANISSLEDIAETDRIALPQPGSIQHILLSMAAQRELGSATAFDNQLVSLNHPDGMQMLAAGGEVTMHFTSPPYLFQEEGMGMKKVISGEEAFGAPFTFIVGTLREGMVGEVQTVQAVRDALQESIDYMQENREETVALLSEQYGIEADRLDEYLYESGLVYSQDILGMDNFVTFMGDAGYVSPSIEDKPLIWSE